MLVSAQYISFTQSLSIEIKTKEETTRSLLYKAPAKQEAKNCRQVNWDAENKWSMSEVFY